MGARPLNSPRRLSRLALSLGFTHAWDFSGDAPRPNDAITGQANLRPPGAAGWQKTAITPNGRGIQIDGNPDHGVAVEGDPFSTEACTYLWSDTGIDVTAQGQAVATSRWGGSNVSAESSGFQVRIQGSTINVIKAQTVNQFTAPGRNNAGGRNVSAVTVTARQGARYACAINGAIRATSTGGNDFNTRFEHGGSALFTGADCPSSTVVYHYLLFAPKVISDEAMVMLTRDPSLLWETTRPALFRAGAVVVDTNLTGAALAQAGAAGALTTSIPLSGASKAAANAAGAQLTTSIRLTGTAASAAAASGTLSTGIALTGAAVVQAGATGTFAGAAAALTGSAGVVATAGSSLLTFIPLTGAPVAQASTAGALSTSVRLSGTGVVQAGTTGALSTSILLTGAAQTSSSAAGAFAGGATQLMGAAVAGSSATGMLSTSVSLTCAAQVQAGASGSFGAVGAALTGTAVVGASAGGTLLTTISILGLSAASASASASFAGAAAALTGAAIAQANASGELSTMIRFAGAAGARGTAVGALLTYVRLAGTAAVRASFSATIGSGTLFARAPAGSGYTPRSTDSQHRPTSAAAMRPSATQRTNR